jgi:hypothetical protein
MSMTELEAIFADETLRRSAGEKLRKFHEALTDDERRYACSIVASNTMQLATVEALIREITRRGYAVTFAPVPMEGPRS